MSPKNIVKCILCDMDGVLRIGNKPVAEKLQNIFFYLKHLKVQPIIITNECRYTNKKIYDDLLDMDIIDESIDVPLITSANVCKSWLENYIYTNKDLYSNFNVCVIGETGLKSNINSINNVLLNVNNAWCDNSYTKNIIVIGSLFKYTQNQKQIVKEWLSTPETLVVKTCDDHKDPEDNCILPNNILKHHNKTAHINMGKPDVNYTTEIQKLLKKYHLQDVKSEEIMLIGDSMNTDIKLGNKMNYKTTLVLSGNTKINELDSYSYKPNYIIPSISNINLLL
jgi:NagD protein